MAARRTERLINLVICLLSTRDYLTAERIRRTVPGYDESDASNDPDEAFKRMFERDKAELRDLGIPLETGRSSRDDEDGYRIKERDYELPPIEFDAAEAAAVGLAARLWQSATLGQAASTATQKLHAAGVAVEAPTTPGLVPVVDTADPNLEVLLDAARHERVVSFDYRKAGAAEPQARTVEPWGVLTWHRRWYVVGFDRDRGEARSFRLSRVEGAVKIDRRATAGARPEGVDLLGMVTSRPVEQTSIARIEVGEGGAGQLRRLADSETSGVLTIAYSDLHYLAHRVASAGGGVTVLEPPELIEAVREQLLAVLGGLT